MHAALRSCLTAASALVASTSVIALTPVAPPPDVNRVSSAAVRLADASSDLLGGLGSLSGLANDLGGLNLGGLANVPYNVFADIVNIPYNEIQAIGTYAAALGPAGQSVVPSVPGLLTTVNLPVGLNGALEPVMMGPVGPGGAFEPLGIAGTGSWEWESVGNTWGWDNGNFAQLDGIANILVPFPQFETPFAEELQVLAEAEIVAGANGGNCEFECASALGNFANWFHVPLTTLLSGYKFPTVLTDSVGANSTTGVINFPQDAVWSNTPVVLNPLLPFESLFANLTGNPANNPIMLPNLGTAITNVINLSNDLNYFDFNPSATGSFLYWGAPTLYSVPAFFGGLLQDLTGIPNQFLVAPFQPLGAEPITGYTASLPQLITGLPQGDEYLVNGLLGYAGLGPLPTGLTDLLNAPSEALSALLTSTGIANLWAQLTTALPNAIANLNTTVSSAVVSNLPGAGAGLASPLGAPPSNGPSVIAGPQSSNVAQVTAGPRSSNGPQVTAGPQSSNGAHVTAGPRSSNGPQVTAGPQSSNRPQVTAGTQSSNRPQVTAGTQPSNRPHVTAGPQPSNRPHVNAGPHPSNRPHVNAGPHPSNRAHVNAGPQPSNRAHVNAGPHPSNRPHVNAGPHPSNGPPVNTGH